MAKRFWDVPKARYPSCPRHNSNAASAEHETTEPTIKQPNALPKIRVQPSPPMKHNPTSQRASTIRCNLFHSASRGKYGACVLCNTLAHFSFHTINVKTKQKMEFTATNAKHQQRHLTMTLEQARKASSKGSRGLFTAESQARDQNERSDIMKRVSDRLLT